MAYFLIRTASYAQAVIPTEGNDLCWGRPSPNGLDGLARIIQFFIDDYRLASGATDNLAETTIAYVDDNDNLTVTARYSMWGMVIGRYIHMQPRKAFNEADLLAETHAERFGFHIEKPLVGKPQCDMA